MGLKSRCKRIMFLIFIENYIMSSQNLEKATFAGGCFWCTEAVFQRVNGVENLRSGFTGGNIKNPPYREVVTGRTGHAESIELLFDPEVISYKDLLYIFFTTHDPTTLNRQGNDIGTHYRSAIFYHDEAQKKSAEEVITELSKQQIFNNPIVTTISEAGPFYEAEEYHENYYNLNSDQPYCQVVIGPKIQKLRNSFANKLKSQQ